MPLLPPPIVTLETLFEGVTAKLSADAERKQATARVKQAKSEPERKASLADLRQLEDLHDWLPVALLFKIECWECSCGSSGNNPTGLFLLQQHTRMARTTRLVPPRRGTDALDGIPRHFESTTRPVSLCFYCADKHGFSGPYIPPAPVAPSAKAFGEFSAEWERLRAPIEEDEEPEDEPSLDEEES